MIPYYEHSGITIYYGDCLEVMAEMEDNSVDLVLTDPPYGATACKWDIIIPFEPMWDNLKRISKDNTAIVITASQPFTSMLVMSNIDMFKYEWIWEKTRPSCFFLKDKQPLRYHENIVVFYKKQPTYNPIKWEGEKNHNSKININSSEVYNIQSRKQYINIDKIHFPKNIIKIKSTDSTKNLHNSQKPVKLMEYLIKTYSNENDIVLDFAMGSGTTLVAAKQLGRQAIGIEIEEKYCEIAVKRLGQEVLELA